MKSAAEPPVVVGIDGAGQARRAARWAAGEAATRGVPLRPAYSIGTDFSGPRRTDGDSATDTFTWHRWHRFGMPGLAASTMSSTPLERGMPCSPR
jgi:nucleotide-binding universal stress UspA family protein